MRDEGRERIDETHEKRQHKQEQRRMLKERQKREEIIQRIQHERETTEETG
jgi:hypothetical protein